MSRRFNYANNDNAKELGFPLWCKQMGESPFINRWALQEFMLYLIENYGSLYRDGFTVSKSFKGCGRNLVHGNNSLTIRQAEKWSPYKPANVFSCSTRTCVRCGWKLAIGDVSEAMRGINEYAYSKPAFEDAYSELQPISGRSVIQICLTCSHTKEESLQKVRDDNMRARHLFQMDRTTRGIFREIGLDAMCISNEFPYGDNGWSFHPHMLGFCHTAVDVGAVESALTPVWQDKVKKVGRRAITGPCLSVDGGEAVKTYLSKQAFELGFGNYGKDRGGHSHLRTLFHILYDCAEWYYKAVNQYGHESKSPEYEAWLSNVLVLLEGVDVMRKKRFFRWTPESKNVFSWLVDDDAQKLKDFEKNGREVMNILNGRNFWRSLDKAERFQLQRFGIRDDFDGLADFVTSRGFEYIDERKESKDERKESEE